MEVKTHRDHSKTVTLSLTEISTALQTFTETVPDVINVVSSNGKLIVAFAYDSRGEWYRFSSAQHAEFKTKGNS